MFVSIKKRSKKEQKKFYSKQRKVWDIPPVTKVIPNKKREHKVGLEELDNFS